MCKGAVHILGEICPRSDPDIAHMEYCLDSLKLNLHRHVCKYGPHLCHSLLVKGRKGGVEGLEKWGAWAKKGGVDRPPRLPYSDGPGVASCYRAKVYSQCNEDR